MRKNKEKISVHEPPEAPDVAVNAKERCGNGIGMSVQEKGKVHRYVINDEHENLDDLIGQEFAILSPVSYFGKSRAGKNAR